MNIGDDLAADVAYAMATCVVQEKLSKLCPSVQSRMIVIIAIAVQDGIVAYLAQAGMTEFPLNIRPSNN